MRSGRESAQALGASQYGSVQSAGPVVLFDRRSPVIDTMFVAVAIGVMLFSTYLRQLTPLTLLAMTPLYVLLRWERVWGVLSRTWLLLLLPLLALASTAWSVEPAKSLRYGFLFLMTVTPALFLGAGTDRDALIKGFLISFALYMALALPFGRWAAWGGGAGQAFTGLMASKNAAGDAAGIAMIVGAIGGLWALESKRRVYLALAAMVFLTGLLSLWLSRATGALIATGLSLPCGVLWVATKHFDLRVRTSIFVIAAIAVVSALATVQFWMPPLFDLVLENSGKDAGLTGRELLWRKADELIAMRPWSGVGYAAFWVHDNPDAEYLWREMGIRSRQGFSFHNTPRGIIVELGFVGFAIAVVTALIAVVALFLRTMIRPDHSAIFACALVVYETPRTAFELLGFQNMHFATLIIFIVLARGLRPNELAGIGARSRQGWGDLR